jgi:membrane-associated protease RseP (regulator of RpoE activity)
MFKKIIALFCIFSITLSHAQQSVSQENQDVFKAPTMPIQDNQSPEELLAQQIRFEKIARKILLAAEPACAKYARASLQPGWVIDAKTDTGKPTIRVVLEGTEAERAGLKPGDILKSIDNENLESMVGRNDMTRVLRAWSYSSPGSVKVGIERNSVAMVLTIETTPSCVQGITLKYALSEPEMQFPNFDIPLQFLHKLTDSEVAGRILEPALSAEIDQFNPRKSGEERALKVGLVVLTFLFFTPLMSMVNAPKHFATFQDKRNIAAATAAVLLKAGYDPRGVLPQLNAKQLASAQSQPDGKDASTVAFNHAQTILKAIEKNPNGNWYSPFAGTLPVGSVLYGSSMQPPEIAIVKEPVVLNEIATNCRLPTVPKFPYKFEPTTWGKLDETVKLPGQSQSIFEGYKEFSFARFPRAFAVTATGEWSYSSGNNYAPENALTRCAERHRQTCYLYAVNSMVVAPKNPATEACWALVINSDLPPSSAAANAK